MYKIAIFFSYTSDYVKKDILLLGRIHFSKLFHTLDISLSTVTLQICPSQNYISQNS